jgi:xylulokinase
MSVLGLDIGTTSCKALLLNAKGQLLYATSAEYPMHYPKPGWAELDPEQVWTAVKRLVASAAAASLHDPIGAIAVSSHGESITPVMEDGSTLYRSITSLDRRVVDIEKDFKETFGKDRAERITDIPVHYKHSLFRYKWFRDNERLLFDKTYKFLCYQDFISMRLGAEPAISPSLAARTMAMESRSRSWSADLLDYAGLNNSKLPRIAESGEIIGLVSNEMQSELGLGGHVKIVSGGHDQCCAALGAGSLGAGDAVDSIGTVEALTLTAPRDLEISIVVGRGYPVYPHVFLDKRIIMAVNPNAGSALRWFRDNMCEIDRRHEEGSEKDSYAAIVEKCVKRPSGLTVLPFFAGRGTPDPDYRAKAAFYGMDLASTGHDIAWAIFESMAFELRLNLEELRKAGAAIDSLIGVGGGAGSNAVMQLRADVLGLPIKIPHIKEAAALGAAMLAGAGTGVFKSLSEAAASAVTYNKQFVPDFKVHEAYEEHFREYKKLRGSSVNRI